MRLRVERLTLLEFPFCCGSGMFQFAALGRTCTGVDNWTMMDYSISPWTIRRTADAVACAELCRMSANVTNQNSPTGQSRCTGWTFITDFGCLGPNMGQYDHACLFSHLTVPPADAVYTSACGVLSGIITPEQYNQNCSAPTCSLSGVLSSLPSNTARGTCTDTLSAGSSCRLSCVSPYQVVTGVDYTCSSAGVLTGSQACADPVCTKTGPGDEVIVPVVGVRYTGPTSAALGSVISVSATVPYPGPGLIDASEVVGSLEFEGPKGVVPCTVSTAVVGTESTAQCLFAVPSTSASGSFPLNATFVYQKDWCTKFVGAVTVDLTLVDLARVQSVADETKVAVTAEVSRASAAEAALRTDLTAEATARAQSDAFLTTALRNETARAVSAEGALAFNLSLVSSRVGALEVAEPSFLFRGLQSGIEVSYPNGQQPGAGIASMLNYPLRFDAPLSARGSAIRYNSTTGVVSLVQPGSYRLDAFIHLYSTQGASVVGTGVVAWMSVGAAGAGAAGGAPPQPIGPNLLNPNAMGVPQGTVGDNTFVSTLLTVPEGTSPTAPFNAQCVLVSMNQRKNQITDASVISVTKLK